MHCEGEVGFRFRREHAGGCEPRVVDEQRVGVAIPVDRVRRVGDDCLEWLVIPVCRVDQRVSVCEVELLVVHVVQEHVDPRKVVGGQVDLLAEEPLADVLLAQHLRELQQE